MAHCRMASSGRDTGGERLLRRPTSLFSQRCLRNAFLLAPLAPCVDALSAGCVLHVKQAADAVREKKKKATRRDKGGGVPGHKEAPPPCHPPGQASLCSPPLHSSPPTQHLSLLCPSTAAPPHPRPLLSIPGSTCHPSITPKPPAAPSTIPLPPS